eukprot:10281-Heterococcus_DN1.PRE.3
MPYLWVKQLTSSIVVHTDGIALVRPQQGHTLAPYAQQQQQQLGRTAGCRAVVRGCAKLQAASNCLTAKLVADQTVERQHESSWAAAAFATCYASVACRGAAPHAKQCGMSKPVRKCGTVISSCKIRAH